MSLGISKEDIVFLKELQNEMLTQDPVCQASPRFWVVRGTVKEYGIQDGWCDGSSIRVDCEGCIDTMEEAYEHLLEHYSNIPYKYSKENDSISYYNPDIEEWNELADFEAVCEFLQDNGNDEAEVIGHREVEKIYENTMFLTNRECKAHIKANYYHYPKDAHSYAMTAWRAPEVEKLWKILDKINWNEVEKSIVEKPTTCGTCRYYSEKPYRCHNETGNEAGCGMGYMNGDMRDKSYRNSLYQGCRLG